MIYVFVFLHSDELPVQLTLPRAFREAANRQQLSSLALLGQEFWRYPMANPKSISSGPSPTRSSSVTKSDSTSGIGTTVFSAHQQKIITTTSHTTVGAIFSPTTPIGMFSQAGTPSDTTSSLSSFTSTGQQMLSPESIDSVVLTMSPVDNNGRNGIFGKTSTFKAQNRKSLDIDKVTSFMGGNLSNSKSSQNVNSSNLNNNNENLNVRTARPTPPSTLNLGPLRIPPAPPPRWAKPITPTSPKDLTSPPDGQVGNNFTVTTTVTFSVEGNQNSQSQLVEVLSPNANTTVR